MVWFCQWFDFILHEIGRFRLLSFTNFLWIFIESAKFPSIRPMIDHGIRILDVNDTCYGQLFLLLLPNFLSSFSLFLTRSLSVSPSLPLSQFRPTSLALATVPSTLSECKTTVSIGAIHELQEKKVPQIHRPCPPRFFGWRSKFVIARSESICSIVFNVLPCMPHLWSNYLFNLSFSANFFVRRHLFTNKTHTKNTLAVFIFIIRSICEPQKSPWIRRGKKMIKQADE